MAITNGLFASALETTSASFENAVVGVTSADAVDTFLLAVDSNSSEAAIFRIGNSTNGGYEVRIPVGGERYVRKLGKTWEIEVKGITGAASVYWHPAVAK